MITSIYDRIDDNDIYTIANAKHLILQSNDDTTYFPICPTRYVDYVETSNTAKFPLAFSSPTSLRKLQEKYNPIYNKVGDKLLNNMKKETVTFFSPFKSARKLVTNKVTSLLQDLSRFVSTPSKIEIGKKVVVISPTLTPRNIDKFRKRVNNLKVKDLFKDAFDAQNNTPQQTLNVTFETPSHINIRLLDRSPNDFILESNFNLGMSKCKSKEKKKSFSPTPIQSKNLSFEKANKAYPLPLEDKENQNDNYRGNVVKYTSTYEEF